MNRSLSSLLLAVGLLAVAYAPTAAKADDAGTAISPFSTATSLDLVSKYVWRGIPQAGSGPSVQPSFTLSVDAGEVGSFSANWWGNWNTRDDHATNNKFATEHDWTGSWSKSFDKLSITAGAIFYYFPGARPVRHETEVFTTASYSGFWLVPTASVYYGAQTSNGFYVNMGVGHKFDLAPDWALNLGVAQGWASSNWERTNAGVNHTGLNDLTATAKLSWAITKNLSTSIYTNFSTLDSAPVRNSVKAARDRNATNLVGGCNMTFTY